MGYTAACKIEAAAMASVTEDYLVKNALAFGSSAKNILADLPGFRGKLHKELGPYAVNGKLNAEIRSWAFVYQRTE